MPRRRRSPPAPSPDAPPPHDADTQDDATHPADDGDSPPDDSRATRLATLRARVDAARAEHAALVTRAALLDARERGVAAAEARLAAARAARAGAAALDPLLCDAVDALRGDRDGGRDAAAVASAALADAVVASAFKAGGGGALTPAAAADLAARLTIAISVGPAAGRRVSLTDMLAWSGDDFLATIGAAKDVIVAAVDAAAPADAVDDAGAAAAALHDLFISVATYRHANVAAVSRAQQLLTTRRDGDDGAAAEPPRGRVSAATLVDRLAVFASPPQVAALLAARADYVRRLAAARARRDELVSTLRGTLLTGAAAGADTATAPPLPRTAYADAVRAAADLRDGVAEEALARVDLAVAASDGVLTVRQRLLYFALIHPGPTMIPDMMEEIAARAGLPPVAAVLAGAAPLPG